MISRLHVYRYAFFVAQGPLIKRPASAEATTMSNQLLGSNFALH